MESFVSRVILHKLYIYNIYRFSHKSVLNQIAEQNDSLVFPMANSK